MNFFQRFRRKYRLLLRLSENFREFIEGIIFYFSEIFRRTAEHHLFLFAGGLAFSLFLCIIPFTLILFWILGNFLDSSSFAIQINTLIDTFIPYDNYSDFVKNILYNRVNEVIEFKNVAGIIGLIGLLFTASGFASSLRTILNKVFGAVEDVNLLVGKLRDFALIIFTVFFFLLWTLFLPVINFLRNISDYIIDFRFLRYGIFQNAFIEVFSFCLLLFLFYILYTAVPVKKIRHKSSFAGALWATILFEGAKIIFGIYIYKFASYGKIYGTYAVVVVVAFWIYYASAVFILGAEVGKLFDERIELKKIGQKNLNPSLVD